MRPKFTEQFAGLGIPAKQLRILDGHATAINRLHLHGLLTQRLRQCADRRLLAKINEAVTKADRQAWVAKQRKAESPIG
jgi:Arc/MetJ family transcription regulator